MSAPTKILCQDKTNSGNGTLTQTATVGATTNTAGNTLTAHVGMKTGANLCTGITDSAGNKWVRLCRSSSDHLNETVDVFICNAGPSTNQVQALAANTGTVTATFSGTGNARELIVIEWPGNFVSPGGDISAAGPWNIASSSSATPPACKVVPTLTTAVVVSTIGYSNNTAPTVAGSFTLFATQNHASGSAHTTAVAYRQEASVTADGAPYTIPSAIASASATFTLILVGGGNREWTDSVPVAGVLTKTTAAQVRAIADSVPVATALARAYGRSVALTDSVPVATVLTRSAGIQQRTTSDSIPLAGALARALVTPRALTDSVPLATVLNRAFVATSRALTDSVPLATALARGAAVRARTTADSVPIATVLARAQGTQLRSTSDSIPLSGVLGQTHAVSRALADSVPVATALARAATEPRTLTDGVAVAGVLTRGATVGARSTADSVPASTALARTQGLQVRAIADSVPVATSAVWHRISPTPLTDSLPLSAVAVWSRNLGRAVVDNVPIATACAVRLHITRSTADSLPVAVVVAANRRLSRALSDVVAFVGNLVGRFISHIPPRDSIVVLKGGAERRHIRVGAERRALKVGTERWAISSGNERRNLVVGAERRKLDGGMMLDSYSILEVVEVVMDVTFTNPDGTGIDPRSDSAFIALVNVGVDPVDSDWQLATWYNTAIARTTNGVETFRASIFVGPGRTLAPTKKLYEYWGRVVDSPAEPKRKLGTIKFT